MKFHILIFKKDKVGDGDKLGRLGKLPGIAEVWKKF
jgi:hypothetical protein